MPIYEYKCDDCGAEREINQRMSEDPITQCPACGAEAFQRLVSASSFALKGGGWYADGYGGGAAKPVPDKKTDVSTKTKETTPSPAAKPAAEPKSTPTKDKD